MFKIGERVIFLGVTPDLPEEYQTHCIKRLVGEIAIVINTAFDLVTIEFIDTTFIVPSKNVKRLKELSP